MSQFSMSQFSMPLNLPPCWHDALKSEFQKDYMLNLNHFLNSERKNKKIIYPQKENILMSLRLTPLKKVRVVILGQDPYHGKENEKEQAMGLCFSVMPGIKPPPSLKNIYKELKNDLGIEMPSHGHLTSWAGQGILMLNSVLTVEAHKAHSHKGIGWEQFTDKIMHILNEQQRKIIFLLWGSPAQKKAAIIDAGKHHLLKAAHPSPLSAYRGFFGQKHFSKTNQLLTEMGETPIDWSLSNSFND